jgi:cystathionine beta-synthase
MGESSGLALWVALQVARDTDGPGALFVVLLPDSGRNYVGKLYNDAWLREVGLLGESETVSDYDWRGTRPSVVVRRGEVPPPQPQ